MDELTAGLRCIGLSNGLTHAVATLGRTSGFLTNVNVRILAAAIGKSRIDSAGIRQGAVVDEFIRR